MLIKTDHGQLPDDMLKKLQSGECELYVQVGYEMYKVKVNKPKEDIHNL